MTREDALNEMEQSPLSEEEGQKMFKDRAKKLQISEVELQSYFEQEPRKIKYKNNMWAFKLGVKLYTLLGLDYRIRK